MAIDWEQGLATLLSELSTVQGDLLALLTEKREMLVTANVEGLAKIAPREHDLVMRLQACQESRASLLQSAAAEGLPSDSIRALAQSLPRSNSSRMAHQVKEATSRARILQHASLTNWVLVQRTLLHLSQMLEIIATGGRSETTYGKGAHARQGGGTLLDQAA